MNERTRTFRWQDPSPVLAAAQDMSGLELFQALLAGKLPPAPISEALDFYLAEAENGRIVFKVEPAEFHYNPIGSVHGGLPATLLDSAMSCAIHSTLPAGMAYTTVEIKVNFVRAITVGTGLLYCIGEVIQVGRRIGTASGKLVDAAGKLYSHGTTTCLIFPLPTNG